MAEHLVPARNSPDVQALLTACPELETRLDLDDGPYGVLGTVARMISQGELSAPELDKVFSFFNQWAEQETCDLDLLATGALEILNDDGATARLARERLRGRALELVEQMRAFWGQPDYSD